MTRFRKDGPIGRYQDVAERLAGLYTRQKDYKSAAEIFFSLFDQYRSTKDHGPKPILYGNLVPST